MAMNHAVQDGQDAADRARRTNTDNWHPVLAAREVEPGHWIMTDPYDRPYGVIRFLRRGSELGYRAVTWAPESGDRKLIGYYRTLRAAAKEVHIVFVRAHSADPDRPSALR
jgi:hypothetical protein